MCIAGSSVACRALVAASAAAWRRSALGGTPRASAGRQQRAARIVAFVAAVAMSLGSSVALFFLHVAWQQQRPWRSAGLGGIITASISSNVARQQQQQQRRLVARLRSRRTASASRALFGLGVLGDQQQQRCSGSASSSAPARRHQQRRRPSS